MFPPSKFPLLRTISIEPNRYDLKNALTRPKPHPWLPHETVLPVTLLPLALRFPNLQNLLGIFTINTSGIYQIETGVPPQVRATVSRSVTALSLNKDSSFQDVLYK